MSARTSQAPFRWGLLSTARINRAIIPPLRASARHALVAVASRDPARAAAYAREWEIPRVHAGYEALLDDPDIDAIYNPLPNALHAAWTIRAARAGKHVLCEKPLATTVADVDAIAEAAAAAGVVVAEAFMYRHHPQTLRLQALVSDGAIGAVQLVRSAFTFVLTRPGDVRWDPAMGGGSLWDVGCYPVSMARLLAGAEPDEVFGHSRLAPAGVDDAFTGQMVLGAIVAQFDCGFRAPLRTHLEIVGTEGVITVPAPFKPGADARLLVSRGDDTQVVTVEDQPLYIGELDDLAEAAAGRKQPRITLADSRGTVAAIVALYESARAGVPVTVPR
jgi:D-xylose 1-dehydrogenase (NADP+, D-xylono-1,5-lactone-forming)